MNRFLDTAPSFLFCLTGRNASRVRSSKNAGGQTREVFPEGLIAIPRCTQPALTRIVGRQTPGLPPREFRSFRATIAAVHE